MWNDLNLTRPLQDICEYSYNSKKDAALIDSLPDLISILTSSAEILTTEHPIWEEVKIYRNLQTKYKRILHCDKCLQYLQRVSTCLRKMVLLDLSSVYLDMADKLIIEIQSKKDATYFLPSRQQLEFVLIRTQSAAKLICESLHYSRETFCYLIQRLKVGHLIINLMMATSVTARLNIVFRGLLVQIYSAYKKIYAWRQKLKQGGWEWSKPLELPEDLESWINLEDSEYVKPRHLPKEELDFLTTIFDKNLLSGKGDQNGYSEPVNEDSMILENADDHGELVERSEVEILEPPQSSIMENIETAQSTSSDEQQASSEKQQKFSKAQKVLLKRIKRAEDIKELKVIWENLDLSAQNLLLQAVTPVKIRLIDKMFLKARRKISVLKKSSVTESEKKSDRDNIINLTRLKFATFLGLLHQPKEKVKKNTAMVIKPVKTEEALIELYNTIYFKLQSAQKYDKCAKLKKIFKKRKAVMKILEESGEEKVIKKLILKTSKLFISDFL
uniref:Nucleolus and neural progenitor protein-like N-terminal domain-containing protein n=1 Tax=Parasteatoda tepidariorum TaxID=114398 RepID=A0A2L2Y6S3_PARTP